MLLQTVLLRKKESPLQRRFLQVGLLLLGASTLQAIVGVLLSTSLLLGALRLGGVVVGSLGGIVEVSEELRCHVFAHKLRHLPLELLLLSGELFHPHLLVGVPSFLWRPLQHSLLRGTQLTVGGEDHGADPTRILLLPQDKGCLPLVPRTVEGMEAGCQGGHIVLRSV